MKNSKGERGSQSKARDGKGNRRRRAANRRRRTARGFSGLMGENLQKMRIADLYRPLKKPVTLRLDADVLAWFKKDGRRYQTRINSALRKVMEREMKLS
ncbi:MAG: BrnA antitoxin family protein [Acidobacteriia bacterium]|nr:BrnA antitoxin family protein [Terriglobia bacterium]